MFSGQVEPASVSQSSTYSTNKAEVAVDGNLATVSETLGSWDTEVWFKMKFDAFICFSQVVIIQSHHNGNAYRMEDAKVFVVNTDAGTENLCGIFKVSPVMTIEGQTYHIPCHLKCGNEVKLTVRHDHSYNYRYNAAIHMREIMAFTGLGMSQIMSCRMLFCL